jgi:pyruvate decarboxylase
MLLHHTLGNGNFNVFADMNREISCAMARLNSPDDAASLIDYNLQQCWIQSRPVYVTLPTDIVQKKIEGERLKTPIDLHFPTNDQAREDYCVDVVLKYLHAAKNPIILVDACAIRHRVLDEVHDLISVTGLPVFVTPSKGNRVSYIFCIRFLTISSILPLLTKGLVYSYGTPYSKDALKYGYADPLVSSGQRCC